jgi:hypothetical protein
MTTPAIPATPYRTIGELVEMLLNHPPNTPIVVESRKPATGQAQQFVVQTHHIEEVIPYSGAYAAIRIKL